MGRDSVRDVKGNGNRPKLVAFSYFVNGAGTPTMRSDPSDVVASIAHTATGKDTITLRGRYPIGVSVQATLTTEEDNRDMFAQGGAFSPNAAGGATLVIKLKTATVNTDLAASGTDRYVSVLLYMDDSNRYA